jgi:3-phosphoglycerate kinase
LVVAIQFRLQNNGLGRKNEPCSTGGGAMPEMPEGQTLPGIQAILVKVVTLTIQ